MRLAAAIVGAWCLVTASALLVVWALPTAYEVRHTVRVEGGAEISVEADIDTSGRIDIAPRPIVIQGLPSGLGL